MVNLNEVTRDVKNIILTEDNDSYSLIGHLISISLIYHPAEAIVDAFVKAGFETAVSNQHLFLSIDGATLRIPLRPLFQGDKDDSSQSNESPQRTEKISINDPCPGSLDTRNK